MQKAQGKKGLNKNLIFFHPDFNRRFRNHTESANSSRTKACAHYRRWGIAPRPEDSDIIF